MNLLRTIAFPIFALFFYLNGISLFSVEISEKTLYVQEAKVLFTSTTDEETIKGIGKKAKGTISLSENKFEITIDVSDWKTANKLQTRHMHDNYIESETFPTITYSGTIQSFKKETGEAQLIGDLQFHGVTKKNFQTTGKLTAKNGDYFYTSEFIINLKEFKIEIPKLLFLKVNENIKVQTEFLLGGKQN